MGIRVPIWLALYLASIVSAMGLALVGILCLLGVLDKLTTRLAVLLLIVASINLAIPALIRPSRERVRVSRMQQTGKQPAPGKPRSKPNATTQSAGSGKSNIILP